MRYPNVSPVVLPGGQAYSADNFLREFAWPHPAWSADEASVAAFDRITAAWKAGAGFEDADYGKLLDVLRDCKFPPHVSLELAHLRNGFVLAPREAHAEKLAVVAAIDVAAGPVK